MLKNYRTAKFRSSTDKSEKKTEGVGNDIRSRAVFYYIFAYLLCTPVNHLIMTCSVVGLF